MDMKKATKSNAKSKIRKSAFRAISNQLQNVISTTVPQVVYEQEQYDLNKEYNPATSTFTAKQNGIYAFFASAFYSTETSDPVTVTIVIFVNDTPQLPVVQTLSAGRGIVITSGTAKLKKGDEVQVFLQATINGAIASGAGTRFEGFRVR
ncbi:C1q-like domain-containing protein [Paenibacillus sp. JDR-2]|uniref:C1q-like domain-containing protein n=1 Tax=Paenibacillus sp. (strain JDR-2) TaxID=324057 RepID=UPI0001664190|nr:complement C1q protein [Paenibacillus sp. JDR-2]ACT02111.1 complement C1q protein [Paenibacillus sp. JDR-2]